MLGCCVYLDVKEVMSVPDMHEDDQLFLKKIIFLYLIGKNSLFRQDFLMHVITIDFSIMLHRD